MVEKEHGHVRARRTIRYRKTLTRNWVLPPHMTCRCRTCTGPAPIIRRLAMSRPYRWAQYVDVPFYAAQKAALRVPGCADFDGGALSAGQGRSGAMVGLQFGCQILSDLYACRSTRCRTCGSVMSVLTGCIPARRITAHGCRLAQLQRLQRGRPDRRVELSPCTGRQPIAATR